MITQCKEEERIVDYIAGNLSRKQKKQFEIHMASCDYCRKEFVMTNKIIYDSEINECETQKVNIPNISMGLSKVVDKLKDTYEKSINWFQPAPLLQPAYAQIRKKHQDQDDQVTSELSDNIELHCLKKNINELYIEVSLTNPMELSSNIRLRIDNALQSNQLNLFLIDKNARVIKGELLDNGGALFEDIPYSSYQINIEEDKETITKLNFTVQKTGIYENEKNIS